MKKNTKIELGKAIFDGVKKEMAEPRKANSVRREEARRAGGAVIPAMRGMAKMKLRRAAPPRRAE